MKPWTRTVKAGGVDCIVTVGEHAMFVRRADGGELADAEHRAALVEALGKAVAQVRELQRLVLREGAQP